jgi:DNA-binding transcriptional MerR regulator
MADREPLLTIAELGARVAEALSDAPERNGTGAAPPDGRVREVPDLRTIRYYTTLGLLDRPAEMRGRTALYGRRHVLQLLAIKRLQGHGESLAAIQRRLLGLPDAELEKLAGAAVGRRTTASPGAAGLPLPPEPDRAAGLPLPPAEVPPERAFWKSDPAPPAAPAPSAGRPDPAPQAIRLGDGVLLILPSATRPPTDGDLGAIRAAAEPLLSVLRRRRLVGPAT